jgi:proline iminopeptidase
MTGAACGPLKPATEPADHVPRSAVDSLAGALPNLTRVVLPGAGHVPWLEVPAEFGGDVLGFLCAP